MKKYLDYHERFMNEGTRHPDHKNKTGLCCAMGYDRMLELFQPTVDEYDWDNNTAWWGGERGPLDIGVYTDLRQNIVLFMAAMNGEL